MKLTRLRQIIVEEAQSLLEGKSVKALKADYEKAISKEQQLSSLMLSNLVKYKQAKASGNEKAIAKHTKIAGQLSPKKKKATEDANKAYQAYEDKISGLHSDAELVIDEGSLDEALARGLKPLLMLGSKVKWTTMSEDALVDLSDKFEDIDDEQADDIASHLNMSIELKQDGYKGDATKKLKQFNKACADALKGKQVKSAFENVNEVESEDDTEFTVKLSHLLKKHVSKGGEIDEGKLNEEDYKYKKYVAKAFDKINDEMFNFRHSMGLKQLTNKDMKLKKQVESIHQAIFKLQAELLSKGLTESKLNEMDINDPILVAIRARQTALKKKAALPKVKKISTKQYYKLMDKESDIIDQMKDAAKEYQRLDSEMNQDAGQKGSNWTDADANRYGGDLNKLQTRIEKLAKEKLKVKKAIMNYRIN